MKRTLYAWLGVVAWSLLVGCSLARGLTLSVTERSHKVELGPMGRLFVHTGTDLTVLSQDTVVTYSASMEYNRVAVAPNGKYVAGVTGDDQLVILDLARKSVRQAGPVPKDGVLAWSPSGERLIVYSPGPDIAVFDASGTKQRTVSVGAGIGRSITWAQDETLVTSTNSGVSRVNLVTGAVTLVADTSPGGDAVWQPSPDGASVITAVDKPDGDHLMLTHNSDPALIVSPAIILAAQPQVVDWFTDHTQRYQRLLWSPDGTRFAASFKLYSGENPRFGLLTASPSGRDLKVWLLPVYPELNKAGIWPPRPCTPGWMSWTDSSRIAVQLEGPGCEGKLQVMTADLTQTTAEFTIPPQSTPVLSADGRWMAFRGADAGVVQVVALDHGSPKSIPQVAGDLVGWSQ